jgi:hypothetical protein
MSDHPRDTRVKCPHFSLDFIDSAMCFGDRQLSRHVAMKIHNEADFSFPDTNIVDIPNDAALCSGRRQCFFNLTMLLFRCFLPIEPVCCHWLNVCVYLGILADFLADRSFQCAGYIVCRAGTHIGSHFKVETDRKLFFNPLDCESMNRRALIGGNYTHPGFDCFVASARGSATTVSSAPGNRFCTASVISAFSAATRLRGKDRLTATTISMNSVAPAVRTRTRSTRATSGILLTNAVMTPSVPEGAASTRALNDCCPSLTAATNMKQATMRAAMASAVP